MPNFDNQLREQKYFLGVYLGAFWQALRKYVTTFIWNLVLGGDF